MDTCRFLFVLAITSLFSCGKSKEVFEDYSISDKTAPLPKGDTIFSTDFHSYLYDLKITDHYYLFLDEQRDTLLWVYRNTDMPEFVMSMGRTMFKEDVWKPVFTKEVRPKDEKEDTIYWIDNNRYLKRVMLDKQDNLSISTLFLLPEKLVYSSNFNVIGKGIYAVPINRRRRNPFYFFNFESGYNWVAPPAVLYSGMPTDNLSYTNCICVNESAHTVVSAFRFTNCISFYQLDGTLRNTVRFNNDLVIPEILLNRKGLDVGNSLKCFIDLCGTPRYVYCLYSGSKNFSGKSKIVIFQWDGKHVKTLESDRSIRSIAVDEDDKYILAIASKENGGQDVIRYELKANSRDSFLKRKRGMYGNLVCNLQVIP